MGGRPWLLRRRPVIRFDTSFRQAQESNPDDVEKRPAEAQLHVSQFWTAQQLAMLKTKATDLNC
jgi:hypothetical protein